jgi:hypothetical protein
VGKLRRFPLIPAALLGCWFLNIIPPIFAGVHNKRAVTTVDYIFEHESSSPENAIYVAISKIPVEEQNFVTPHHVRFLIFGENEVIERSARIPNATARDGQSSETRSDNNRRSPLCALYTDFSRNSMTIKECGAFPNVFQLHMNAKRQPESIMLYHFAEVGQFWSAGDQVWTIAAPHTPNLLSSGISGFNGCASGPNGESQRNEQYKGTKNPDSSLEFIEPYRIFGGLRHAPLFTQVSLIMVLGLMAFGIGPIGFGLILFSVEPNVQRKRVAGLLFFVLGALALGAIEGLIFLS